MRKHLYPDISNRRNLKCVLTYMKNEMIQPGEKKLEFLTVEERVEIWKGLDHARKVLDEEG